MRYNLSEIAHAVWLPISSGLLTAGVTWLVWYFSTAHCTPANAAMLMCEVTPLGRYLTSAALHDCIIHAGIVMTLTGGSDVMLFLRERRHNAVVNAALEERVKAAEQRADEERQRADEERQRNAEERRLADAERQRISEERRLADAERQRIAEERQQQIDEERRLAAEERRLAAEERQRAEQRIAEQHQAMLDLMVKLGDAVDHNRNGHNSPQS